MKFKLGYCSIHDNRPAGVRPMEATPENSTVWWGKGFYEAEDDAWFAAIKKLEAKNPKIKVDLSLYAPQEMIPKSVAVRSEILRMWPMVTLTIFR